MAPSGGKKGKEVDQSPASILRHGDYTVSLTSWLAGGPAVIGKKPRRVLDMKVERDRKSEKSDQSLVLASSKKSDTAASDMEVISSRSSNLTRTSGQRRQTESFSSQRVVSSRPFLTYEEERIEKFTIRPPPVVFNNPEDVPTDWLQTILNQRKYGESSKAVPKKAISYAHSDSDDYEAGYGSPHRTSKPLSKKSSSSSRKPSKIRIETKSSSRKGTRKVEVTTADASDESDNLSSDVDSHRRTKTKKLEHRSKTKERRKTMKIHAESSDEESADEATADSELSDIESTTIKLRSKPTSKNKPIASSKKSGSARVKIETRDKKGKRKVVVEALSEEEVSSNESRSKAEPSPPKKSKSKNRVTVTETTRKGKKKIVTVESSDEGETAYIKSRSSMKGKKSEIHIKAGGKAKTKKVTFETTDEAEITEDATTDAEPVPTKAHKGKDKVKTKTVDKGKTKAKKRIEIGSSEAAETTDAETTDAETTEAATTEAETTDAEVAVAEKPKATPASDDSWTPSQDAILLGMKEGGESWASIAKATGQNKKAVIKRHQELVKSGVAQVGKKGNQNKNNKKEQKAKNMENKSSNDAGSSQPPAAEETFGFGDLPGFGGDDINNDNNDNNGDARGGGGDQNNDTSNHNNGGGDVWGNGGQNNNGFGDAGWGGGDQDNNGGGNVGPGFGDGWAADCTGGNSKLPSNAGSKSGLNQNNRPPSNKPPSNSGNNGRGGDSNQGNNSSNKPLSNNGSRNNGGSNNGSNNNRPPSNNGGGSNQGNRPPSNSGNNGWGGGSNQGNKPPSNNGGNNDGSNQGTSNNNRPPSNNGGFGSGSNQGHRNNNNSRPPSNNEGQGSGSNNGNRPPSNNGNWGSGSNHGGSNNNHNTKAPSNNGGGNNGGGPNHGGINNNRPPSNNGWGGGSNQGNSNRPPSNNGDWGNSGPAQDNNAGWASGSNQGSNNYNKPHSNAGSARGSNSGRPPSNKPPSSNGNWGGGSNEGNRPPSNGGWGSRSNQGNKPPSNNGGWGSGSNSGNKPSSNNGSNRGSSSQQGNQREKDESEKDREIKALKERVSEEKLHRLEAEVFALRLQHDSANRLNQSKQQSENGNGMGWNTGGSDKNWKVPHSVAGSVRSNNNQPDGWKSRPASGEVWENPDYKPASNSGWVPNEIVPPQADKPSSNNPPSNTNKSPGSPDGWIYGSPTESEKQRVAEKVESWKGSISPPKEGRWGTPVGGWPAERAENAPDKRRGRSPAGRSSASAKNWKQGLTRVEEELADNGYEMWKKPASKKGKSGGNADRKSSGNFNKNNKQSGEQYGWNYGHDAAAEPHPPRGSQISTPEFNPFEPNEWAKGTMNDKPPSKNEDWTPGLGATAGWMADCTKPPSKNGWAGESNQGKDTNKLPNNAGSARGSNNRKSPSDNGGWTFGPITGDPRQNIKTPSLTGLNAPWAADCTGDWDGKPPANNKPSKKDNHKNALNIHTVTDLPGYNRDVDMAPLGLSGFPPDSVMDYQAPAPVPVPATTPYSDLPGRYPATPYSSKGTKTPHSPDYFTNPTTAPTTILPLYNKHTPFYDANPPAAAAPGPSYQVGQRSSHLRHPALSESDLESLYKSVVFAAISSGQLLLQPKPDHLFTLRDCWVLIALNDQYNRSSASKEKWFDLQAKFASATGGKRVDAIVLRAKVRQAEKEAKKVEGWEDEEVGRRYKAWRDKERERERERGRV